MTRMVKDWSPERVEDTELAPHRYRWDEDREPVAVEYRKGGDAMQRALDERKAFMAAVPYKVGEVVMVERGQRFERARITHVFTERNRHDELREKYRVQFATVKGLWSRVWFYVSPGEVQRGYQRAGLAPEMPAREKL